MNTLFSNRPLPQGAHVVPPHATKVFQGVIFDVYHYEQEQFDGTVKTFEMLKRPDTVIVLPVKENGKLWVLREEQPGNGVRELYLPGGRVDTDDPSVLAAAKRECEEEIGVRFRDWYYIESVQPVSKVEWFVHIFMAENPYETVPTRHDSGEKIEIRECTYEQFRTKSSEADRSPLIKNYETLADLRARVVKVV